MLNIGDLAPDFSAMADNGEEFKLSSLLGSRVILYFYPKDNTPGCTQEACDFRDLYDDFSSQNAKVIGVSTDSVKSHQNFTAPSKNILQKNKEDYYQYRIDGLIYLPTRLSIRGSSENASDTCLSFLFFIYSCPLNGSIRVPSSSSSI